MTIKDIQKRQDLHFVDLSQEIDWIKDFIGENAKNYDTFFVKIEDGDFTEVYGIDGTIPYLDTFLYRII
jgi:hypothetical protein